MKKNMKNRKTQRSGGCVDYSPVVFFFIIRQIRDTVYIILRLFFYHKTNPQDWISTDYTIQF